VLNIEFSIPRLSPVSLVVYDVRGREVALLIEERLPEGRYSIKWDCGESISSGVYFIHLRTDRQSKLLKRIYLK
ncbi:T9SS type A sorting domain-containing protein, partial [bacterium]|nr:T9SS type A sorting domain-containing protein [bacterium]